jgi:glutamate formiminotransferase
VLEAVPNVSEGRDPAVIRSIRDGFGGPGVSVLDVHSDPDHHRSVFTLAGPDESLVDALVRGLARALELVDLRSHEGVHPRVGVVDVVPLVPLVPDDMEAAKAAALTVASRIGEELRLPVLLYGEVGEGRRPAFFRRGGLTELARRVEAGEVLPVAGPRRLDPCSGAVLVGARAPLVAYNALLSTDDVDDARAIAAAVRESSGGMPGVQAIGLHLPRAARAQVSMNVVDLDRAPLHEVVERVEREALARGARVVEWELVGLVFQRVLDAARAAGADVPGVDESRVVERALGL